MPFLLIGLLTLILCLHFLRELGRATPQQRGALRRAIARMTVRAGGVFVGVAALFLALRGEWAIGALLGGFGYYLLTGRTNALDLLGVFRRGAPRRKTTVLRTPTLEATLRDGVIVDAVVLSGPFIGRRLGALSRPEFELLRSDCVALDPAALAMLEAYLNRGFAGRGAAGERDADPRRGGGVGRNSGEMSEQQAYQTLGVQPGASAEEITRAHRRLMKERHPDHGGSTDDAARLNQAKDRLMRRHG